MDQSYAQIGARNLQRNRRGLAEKLHLSEPETAHTPPAIGHYPHVFLWDSCFAAIISARAGGQWAEAARREMLRLVKGQDPKTGFIPNMQFIKHAGRQYDLERWLAFGGKKAHASTYTQPPVLALAVQETYAALLQSGPKDQAAAFLQAIYGRLRNYYLYWQKYRSNSPADPLIGVIHEHETGRDSDPTFRHKKPLLLPRWGLKTPFLVDLINTPIDYAYSLQHSRLAAKAGGDVAAARRHFWVNDVMMNCIYVDNLQIMAELAKAAKQTKDVSYFSALASRVETAIYQRLWEPGREVFYALDQAGQMIREVSISNLFPLVLPEPGEVKLTALLNLMDQSFNAPYPLPSVAVDSRYYDPHNHMLDRLWAGLTWINANWYLVDRGLRQQILRSAISKNAELVKHCQEWIDRIIKSSQQLVDNGDPRGPYEYYDAITGRPLRKRIKGFAWSNLAYVM